MSLPHQSLAVTMGVQWLDITGVSMSTAIRRGARWRASKATWIVPYRLTMWNCRFSGRMDNPFTWPSQGGLYTTLLGASWATAA